MKSALLALGLAVITSASHAATTANAITFNAITFNALNGNAILPNALSQKTSPTQTLAASNVTPNGLNANPFLGMSAAPIAE